MAKRNPAPVTPGARIILFPRPHRRPTPRPNGNPDWDAGFAFAINMVAVINRTAIKGGAR